MVTSPRRLLFPLTAFAALASCGGDLDDNSSDDDLNGPCVHYYYEPVVNIDQVISNPANTEIARVSLTEVVHEDSEVELEEWCDLQADELCYGLSFESETPVCSLPCGFGNDEGEWHIEISAEGYQSKTETLEASYAVFEGGCPSYDDEGSHFQLELEER